MCSVVVCFVTSAYFFQFLFVKSTIWNTVVPPHHKLVYKPHCERAYIYQKSNSYAIHQSSPLCGTILWYQILSVLHYNHYYTYTDNYYYFIVFINYYIIEHRKYHVKSTHIVRI